MTKFCKDCKWCEPAMEFKEKKHQFQFSSCDNPNNLIYYTDLISGNKNIKRKQYYCSTQRILGRFSAWELGRCGKRGRWYERSNV